MTPDQVADTFLLDVREPFEWQANMVTVGKLSVWATWLRAGIHVRPKSPTDAYQLTVQKVAIDGTTAAAQVKVETGKKDRIQSIGLEKQGQGWRISRLR